jgi:hypothetical protein
MADCTTEAQAHCCGMNILQAVQDTQRGAQAASRAVANLQGELRDLRARQGGSTLSALLTGLEPCTSGIMHLIELPAYLAGGQCTYPALPGDPLMAFGGAPMKALMRAVEAAVNQGRFHRPPLGPLGSLLTLTDETWALPVEV